MPPLVVFLHTALLPKCQERIDQYILLMKNSGLFDNLLQLYIDCVGEGQLPVVDENDRSRVTITRINTDLNEFEFPTQHHMWEYAKEHPESYILYLHTKGVGKEVNQAIEDWVAYMTYFLIEQWRVCVKELEDNKTVGVDLRPEFHLHYSGNFWWSRADWMKLLPDPEKFRDPTLYKNVIDSPRHQAEFWICSDAFALGHVNLRSSNIPVGERHVYTYPRSNYTKDQ